MIKLYESVKVRWLEALRSGEYWQVGSTLGFPKENRFCCLGLACHLFVPADGKRIRGGVLEVLGEDQAFHQGMPTFYTLKYFGDSSDFLSPADDSVAHVPWEVHLDNKDKQMIGVRYPEAYELLENSAVSLAGLNDARVPFTVIADLIEKYAETVPDPE